MQNQINQNKMPIYASTGVERFISNYELDLKISIDAAVCGNVFHFPLQFEFP
jgi:imidazole glycerol phosphate synthase subunit HisF